MSPYEDAIPLLEEKVWESQGDASLVARYQALCREMEAEIESVVASGCEDTRHNFVIVIPIADRPRHLEACLASLLELCEAFRYGGRSDGRFRKVAVIVADDSRQPDNIEQHQQLARRYEALGIETEYFGLEQQRAMLARLCPDDGSFLPGVLGEMNGEAFYHKGASVMRNIAYLRLAERAEQDARLLGFFIDSDQEFRVRLATPSGPRDVSCVNYFYHLDRIFSDQSISVVTGKVVGDPPVSPAVMAGNFLEDVIGFLQRMAELAPDSACSFHADVSSVDNGVAYHDMAGLFGYQAERKVYAYACPVQGEHDHRQCLQRFGERLARFFDGEHPTRMTYYRHERLDQSVVPARTIYTGNYVVRPAALKYFIPFAGLKLRMAGPVLGRIIRAEQGAGFVSANLPMLHRRTLEASGRSEFRPGITHEEACIDLSGEFERQFFGDVLLFSMDALIEAGFPGDALSLERVESILEATEQRMLSLYRQKHADIVAGSERLDALLESAAGWWVEDDGLAAARRYFQRFNDNIKHNFGEAAATYAGIESQAHRESRRRQIAEAVIGYEGDRSGWERLLEGLRRH